MNNKITQPIISEEDLAKRWKLKQNSVYNLKNNIDRLKYRIKQDLISSNEKDMLTALVIRIMILTSERVGNESSASNGHFGITQFKNKHIEVIGHKVFLNYKGKSGVDHEKEFSDIITSKILTQLKKTNKDYIFVTSDGFRIKPDRVNRYLKQFDAKSKDIRGFNANRLMILELNRIGKIKDEKERPKVFNKALKKVAQKIGHGAPTLRKHYLLPIIEETFYKKGVVSRIKI
jgi:DNA topoisomerase-1